MSQSVTSHNRSVSNINMPEELTDEELLKQVTDLKENISILRLENEILETTIQRLEPALMNGVQQALDYAIKITSQNLGGGSTLLKSPSSRFESLMSPSRLLLSPSRLISSPSKLFSSPSRVSKRAESFGRVGGTVVVGGGPRINVIERTELVTTVMEILTNNLEKEKEKAAKKHAFLKAQLEEIAVRVSDIEKAVEDFDQQVIVEGWDRIAQRIPAEEWIKYMREWVKVVDSAIGKMRLRTSTLNSQYSKLKGQLKLKAELNDSLRPVDFEKLEIENSECLISIDKKMQQLVELKQLTGDANLNLTIHKKAMMAQNSYLSKILNTIKNKEKTAVECCKEKGIIQVQADSLEQKLQKVKTIRLAYEVPEIMDYVKTKAELADLKHSVKLLENRLHIQQIALSSLNKRMHSLKKQSCV